MDIASLLIPLLLAGTALWALRKRIDVYDALTAGASEGLLVLARIAPSLIALLTAVYMLRASGALTLLTRLLTPVLERLGIPPETAALLLVRPVSGSGALAVGSQLMEQYGDTYKANGIGLNTVQRFERILIKSSDLLELVYGVDGETPVSDADLTSHLENNMYELAYYTIPLYNTSTYAFADDDQTTEMLNLAQSAIDDVNSYAATLADLSDSTNSSMLMGAFSGVVTSALPDIYKVLNSTYSSDSDAPSLELIGDSTVTSAFTAEGAADTIRGLSIGQAAAVKYNSYALMAALRLDPLSLKALDDLRGQVLNDMKGEELSEALTAYGASLEHNLSSSAMNRMPASKIVNSSTN